MGCATPEVSEAVSDWFGQDDDVPFMMQVFQIRPEKRSVVPAVCHVDGSGRLQTVHAGTKSLYHQLISEFCRLTSFPIVLNTFLQRKRTGRLSYRGSARLLFAHKHRFVGTGKFLDRERLIRILLRNISQDLKYDITNAETEIIIEAGHTERNYWRDLFRYRELFYLLVCHEFWFVASKPTSALLGF